MNESQSELELKAHVLTAPAYQERCEVLLDIFKLTRQWDGNPQSLLAIQAALANFLMDWQEKKKEFKQEKNQVGVAVVNRLNLIVRRIIDSLVWRVFGFDRVLIQLLSEHPQTGHVDDTLLDDFALAKQIIDDSNTLVLVNDLTTTLLHGDLTIIEPGGQVSILENKSGKSSRRNKRAIRQRHQLKALTDFLNTGSRISKDGTHDYIFRAGVALQTYHTMIASVIDEARNSGYARKVFSGCFAIEAVWMDHLTASMPEERPFVESKHALSQTNLDVFDKGARRIVPYGVFPFDDETCFALLSGDLLLTATLNFDALKELHQQSGLLLELPAPTDKEIQTYITAPIGERMQISKQSRQAWFVIRRGSNLMRFSPDYWGRILLEFLHEDTIVQTHVDLMDQIAGMSIADDETTRMYFGYKDETTAWV